MEGREGRYWGKVGAIQGLIYSFLEAVLNYIHARFAILHVDATLTDLPATGRSRRPLGSAFAQMRRIGCQNIRIHLQMFWLALNNDIVVHGSATVGTRQTRLGF